MLVNFEKFIVFFSKKVCFSSFGGMFLPVLLLIIGIRSCDSANVLCSFLILLCLLCALLVFIRNHPWKIGLLRLYFFVIISVCLGLAGMAYAKAKGCSNCHFGKKFFIRSVQICITPAKICPKEGGIFYGYGIVDNVKTASKRSSSRILGGVAGKRIFFSVSASTIGKIPLVGQKFIVEGNLRSVNAESTWWFDRHLSNMRISQVITDGCLIGVEAKSSIIRVASQKVYMKFLRIFRLGSKDYEIESGIMIGMLTANKQFIDKPLSLIFSNIGIAHLFAVSGIHIGIIAVTMEFFLKLFCINYKCRIVLVLTMLIVYVNVIGCSPSALRAVLMVFFYYTSAIFGRRPNVLSALANSALTNIIYDPFVAFNISFLLSYTVVAGIILVGLPVQRLLRQQLNKATVSLYAYDGWRRVLLRTKYFLVASFAISFAANIVGLPLSVEYFGTLFLFSILVNIVVVPIATCAIVTGSISLFLGLLGCESICSLLNKVAFCFIRIFRYATQCLYFESICFDRLKLPLFSGHMWTAILLSIAYFCYVRGKMVISDRKSNTVL